MKRKRIAVLMASIDREYQQDFAAGLASVCAKYNTDICIFNTQGHMNIAISTSEVGESCIYDLPDLSEFDGIISLPMKENSILSAQPSCISIPGMMNPEKECGITRIISTMSPLKRRRVRLKTNKAFFY